LIHFYKRTVIFNQKLNLRKHVIWCTKENLVTNIPCPLVMIN